MRTTVLVALLGLSLAACEGSVPGDPNGGAPDASGGDVDAAGSGSGSQGPTPAVALSVDHQTITSDLNVVNTVTVTATGTGGFSGTVDLNASIVDPSTGATLADWTPASFDNSALTLSANGTASATLTISVPANVASLMGKIKVMATSTAAAAEQDIAFTANPTLDIMIGDNAGQCVYPAQSTYTMALGRTIKVIDGSATLGMTVHVNGGISGFVHQPDVSPAGGAYSQTPTSTGSTTFYCHDGNPNTMTDPGAAGHMTLTVQ